MPWATPYERRSGRRCRVPLAKFGEHVYYKPSGKVTGGNMNVRWLTGVWLGHTRSSSEHVLGTADGVIRAYSVKREDPDRQWSADAIRKLRGSRRPLDPSKLGAHVPVRIRFDHPQQQQQQQQQQQTDAAAEEQQQQRQQEEQQRVRAPLRWRIMKNHPRSVHRGM